MMYSIQLTVISLLLFALASLLSLLLAARLKVMLLPHLLHVVVELFLCYLQRVSQVLENLSVVVLFCPVGRVKSVVISDSRLNARGNQELCDFRPSISCSDVQR